MKYVCAICGYIYDEAENPVPFSELPDDWKCPMCGAPKELFNPVEEEPEAEEEPAKEDAKPVSDRYVCPICGYIYDDAENPVPFSELPDDWKCPMCGAPKELFQKIEDEPAQEAAEPADDDREIVISDDHDDLVMLSAGELSALFSNLARGCEKQYQEEAMKCFAEIASYFEDQVPETTDVDVERLAGLIREDLDTNYKALISAAKKAGDRGTLRITTWGEKVTRMASSLISRYLSEGDAFLENTGLYICTVCGFLYVGDNPPEICPVCKVPGWKFERIDGREI